MREVVAVAALVAVCALGCSGDERASASSSGAAQPETTASQPWTWEESKDPLTDEVATSAHTVNRDGWMMMVVNLDDGCWAQVSAPSSHGFRLSEDAPMVGLRIDDNQLYDLGETYEISAIFGHPRGSIVRAEDRHILFALQGERVVKSYNGRDLYAELIGGKSMLVRVRDWRGEAEDQKFDLTGAAAAIRRECEKSVETPPAPGK